MSAIGSNSIHQRNEVPPYAVAYFMSGITSLALSVLAPISFETSYGYPLTFSAHPIICIGVVALGLIGLVLIVKAVYDFRVAHREALFSEPDHSQSSSSYNIHLHSSYPRSNVHFNNPPPVYTPVYAPPPPVYIPVNKSVPNVNQRPSEFQGTWNTIRSGAPSNPIHLSSPPPASFHQAPSALPPKRGQMGGMPNATLNTSGRGNMGGMANSSSNVSASISNASSNQASQGPADMQRRGNMSGLPNAAANVSGRGAMGGFSNF